MSDEPQYGARAGEARGQFGAPDDPEAQPYDGRPNPGAHPERQIPLTPPASNGGDVGYGQQRPISWEDQPGGSQVGGSQAWGPQVGGSQPGMPQQQVPPAWGANNVPPVQMGGGVPPQYPQQQYPPQQGFPSPQAREAFYTKQVPGRGGPITLIVVGALMTFVLSILSFFVVTVGVSAVKMSSVMDSGAVMSTEIGQTVEVSQQGMAVLVVPGAANEEQSAECTLDKDGTSLAPDYLQSTRDGGISAVWYAVPAGDYQINCSGVSGKASFISGQVLSQFTKVIIPGMIVATLIGIGGIVLMIVGIVKLSRRKRNIAQYGNGSWGGPAR